MTSVLVVGAGSYSLGRAIASALNDFAIKVAVACDPPADYFTFDMAYRNDRRQTEQHKRAWRNHAQFLQAGIQQRRKALTKFHAEKRAKMAHKQAKKRRNRFV